VSIFDEDDVVVVVVVVDDDDDIGIVLFDPNPIEILEAVDELTVDELPLPLLLTLLPPK